MLTRRAVKKLSNELTLFVPSGTLNRCYTLDVYRDNVAYFEFTYSIYYYWTGHVLRHDSLLKTVIEGRLQAKKTTGRPRAMLLDALMHEDEENGIDRETWRR